MSVLDRIIVVGSAAAIIFFIAPIPSRIDALTYGKTDTSDIGRYQVRNVAITTTTFWGQGKASDEEHKLLIRLDTSTGEIVRWYSTITVDKNEKYLSSEDNWLKWYGQESR